MKFAAHTGASPIAGRFTPGTFTNQIQKAFREPRLLVVTDPRSDSQVYFTSRLVGGLYQYKTELLQLNVNFFRKLDTISEPYFLYF